MGQNFEVFVPHGQFDQRGIAHDTLLIFAQEVGQKVEESWGIVISQNSQSGVLEFHIKSSDGRLHSWARKLGDYHFIDKEVRSLLPNFPQDEPKIKPINWLDVYFKVQDE